MPIYAYRCQNCGFAKDVLQKVSDAPLTDCPSCNQPTFKKQLTAAGFQLKGTGWYVTDFRGGSGNSSSPAKESSAGSGSSTDGASESSGSSASTDKSDTKPDAT
jgi:putative FmdB family regulatory protein